MHSFLSIRGLRGLLRPLWYRLPALLGLAGLVLPAAAQFQPRGAVPLSTGGGGPAFVRDHDALFFNPANLALSSSGHRLWAGLGSLSLYSGGDLFQFRYYNEAFTAGRRLTTKEKQRLLDGWFGPKGDDVERTASAHADFIPFSLFHRTPHRTIGVALRARLYARVSANRGWLDLLLFGTPERGQPIPLNATWRALSTLDLTVAYSRRLTPRLTIGLAPKLILGTDHIRARFRSSLHATERALIHRFDYSIQSAGRFVNDVLEARITSSDRLEKFDLFTRNPYTESSLLVEGDFLNPYNAVNGIGAGLDFGATYAPVPGWLVAVSITDLGFIRWARNAQRIEPVNKRLRFEGLRLDADRLRDEFDGQVGRYTRTALEEIADTTYTTIRRAPQPFHTGLPAAFHVGATWRVPGRPAHLNAGTSVAFNDIAGNVTRAPAVYAGGEYRLGDRFAVPLRGGVRVGGLSALSLSLGTGLDTPLAALNIGFSATPYTDWLGNGGRYTLGFGLTVYLR